MIGKLTPRAGLWRSAGRSSVKRFARTTVGGKILRAAYDSFFESAGGDQRVFRGLYRDFASATADAPPGKQVGYGGENRGYHLG
jgi:hypothetical protein